MPKTGFLERIDEFHRQAAELVNYENFGTGDSYYQHLKVMLDWADRDVQWTDLGREAFPQKIIGFLAGRLLAEKGFAEFPDYINRPIEKPIIVVGFRSGTTLFHKLLASAPGTQTLEFWLANFPMPRPPRESWGQHFAFQAVHAGLEQMSQLVPEFHSIHSMSADEPDESHRADQLLTSPGQMERLWSPGYIDWTFQQDQIESYQRFYRELQLIGYQNPNKWVLKCPFHMGWTELTLKTFPDATIIHTYRDASEIIPSVCSITHTFLSPFQKLDKKVVGEFVLNFFGTLLDRYVESRKKMSPEHFYDIDYRDIVAKPVESVRNVFLKNDGNFTPEQEAAVIAQVAASKQGKHGKHSYSAEEYGLSREIIRERTKNYLDFYGI